MNSRLYELLRKYEHRGITLYNSDDDLTVFSLGAEDKVRMAVFTDGSPEVFVYRFYGPLVTDGLGGIITDDDDDLYAEVERWFSGEAG